MGKSTTRQRLYKKQGGKCLYCARDTLLISSEEALTHQKGIVFTVDHIVPRSEGGTRQRGNVFGACNKCNSTRGTHNWTDYMAFMEPVRHGVVPYEARRKLFHQYQRDNGNDIKG